MRRVLTRIPVLDACLGGALVVASAVTQATDDSLPQPWVSVVAALWSASVLLRTVAPFAMVLVWSAGAVAYVALPTHTTDLVAFFTLLVVVFSAGERLTGRRLLAAVGLMLGAMYVVQVTTAHRPGGDTAFSDVYLSPIGLIFPAAGGVLLRRSRRPQHRARAARSRAGRGARGPCPGRGRRGAQPDRP